MIKSLALLLMIVLKPTIPTEPVLKATYNLNYNYEAINPMLYPVELLISCVGNFEVITLNMSPRTQQQLLIKRPEDGGAATCFLESWRKIIVDSKP